METLLADIRQALRTLRKNPSFTLVAIAALTIGIGANTGIFSVVNKVMLQPLPYPEPDRLVQLGRSFTNGVGYSNSIPKYMVWRNNNVFSSMAIYNDEGPGLNLSSGDHPQQIEGVHISADYFKVFGISPMLGRTFTAAEDLPGGPKAAIISEGLWRSHFGSDPKILSSAITLNSETYPVIGVIPSRFIANPQAEVWIPLQADPNSTNQAHYLSVAARLKPGVTLGQAQSEMRAVGERFRRLYPKIMDKSEQVAVTPMRDAQIRNMKNALYVLLTAVAFVLLIACANVANLLLARSAARQRELAIRAALGASRWRVVRQLLTESILLSAAGGVLGLLLGVIGVRGLLLLVPGDIPRLSNPDQLQGLFALVDWRILMFTAGVSVVTGILFGLFPALQVSNPNLAGTLKEAGTRSATSRHQNLTRKTLVAVEMALALVLLTSAALLIRTFVGLSRAELGVDSHHVLTMFTSLSGQKYQTSEGLDLFTRQVLQRVESIPGVEAAASSIVLPAKGTIDLPFNIVGKAIPAGQDYSGDEQWRSVSAHYFSLLRVPLRQGRMFTDHETRTSAKVAIVNAAFAKKFFPDESAIGKSLEIGKGLGPAFDEPPREIVGVVGDVCESGVAEGKVPVMYIPQSQQQEGLTKLASSVLPLAWEVRSSLDEKSLAAAAAKEIQAVDGQMPVARVRTLDKVLQDSLSRQNFNMLLLAIFAGSALLLAAIGIYGLMSYSVEQQTQEIGVRMALGADKPAVVRLVMRQGMKPALIGVAAGLAVAFGVTRLMGSLLYGVKATDPVSFLGVAAILIVVAVVAVLIPARRAMSVDPVVALRSE
jgi:predicted permease